MTKYVDYSWPNSVEKWAQISGDLYSEEWGGGGLGFWVNLHVDIFRGILKYLAKHRGIPEDKISIFFL